MSSKIKYFTVEEADARIPELNAVFQKTQGFKNQIEEKVEGWRRRKADLTDVEEALLRGQIDFLISEMEIELERITNMGALPKDLDSGLVDFPVRINGREGYLCWKFGEDRVRHWHGLTEGFKGRQPLPKDR